MMFEYLSDNFVIDGDRSINSSRNNLLEKVANFTWNTYKFDILIEAPQNIDTNIVNEFYSIVQH